MKDYFKPNRNTAPAMILSLYHTLLSLISQLLQWGKIGRCFKHRIRSMRSVFKPEVTNPTPHNKRCWVLSIPHQLIPAVYSLGVEGFTLISSDCSLAEAELWAVTCAGLQNTVLPPSNFSILCKNHRISLTASASQAKQPGSTQRSSWVFVSGLLGVKREICQGNF